MDKQSYMAFSPVGSLKKYAPMRDILYCFRPIIKTALDAAGTIFSEDAKKIDQLNTIAIDLAKIAERAKTEKDGLILLRDYFEQMQKIDTDIAYVFYMYVTHGFMARYITGMRESMDKPDISETEFNSSLKCILTGMVISDDIYDKVVQAFKDTKRLMPEMIEGPLFKQVAVDDDEAKKEVDDLHQIKNAIVAVAYKRGVSVDEIIKGVADAE